MLIVDLNHIPNPYTQPHPLSLLYIFPSTCPSPFPSNPIQSQPYLISPIHQIAHLTPPSLSSPLRSSPSHQPTMSNPTPTMNNMGTHPPDRHILSASQTRRIIAAAASESAAINIPVNIAVADPAGQLLGFLRCDNAFPGSIDIALRKAKTVSLFNGAWCTGDLYDLTQPGGVLYGIQDTNGGLVVFGGGVPVMLDGKFVGSVGVSGGTTGEDVKVCLSAFLISLVGELL